MELSVYMCMCVCIVSSYLMSNSVLLNNECF